MVAVDSQCESGIIKLQLFRSGHAHSLLLGRQVTTCLMFRWALHLWSLSYESNAIQVTLPVILSMYGNCAEWSGLCSFFELGDSGFKFLQPILLICLPIFFVKLVYLPFAIETGKDAHGQARESTYPNPGIVGLLHLLFVDILYSDIITVIKHGKKHGMNRIRLIRHDV